MTRYRLPRGMSPDHRAEAWARRATDDPARRLALERAWLAGWASREQAEQAKRRAGTAPAASAAPGPTCGPSGAPTRQNGL